MVLLNNQGNGAKHLSREHNQPLTPLEVNPFMKKINKHDFLVRGTGNAGGELQIKLKPSQCTMRVCTSLFTWYFVGDTKEKANISGKGDFPRNSNNKCLFKKIKTKKETAIISEIKEKPVWV